MSESYYFGLPDSAKVPIEILNGNHFGRKFERTIKAYDNSTGIQIIVGIKGSGKTNIRRYIQSKEKDAMIFSLDADNAYLNIDTELLKGRSGRIKNIIAIELLRALTKFISLESKDKSKIKGAFKKLFDEAQEVLTNIPDAVDLKAYGVNVNLKKLLDTNSTPIVTELLSKQLHGIQKALDRKRCYIMIDDAEDIFPGIESNIDFLEGLSRAVNDVNGKTKKKLHILFFLKYGIWRNWFESPKEYDKVKDIIKVLDWNDQDLCQMLAYRIANIHNLSKKLSVEKLWAMEFDWGKRMSFEKFSKNLINYCVSGPRDLISICNDAKINAGKDKIKKRNIDAILNSYSEEKVFAINADFGDVYENIHKFVERVFMNAPNQMEGNKFADWIDDHGLSDEKVEPEFKNYGWFKESSKEKLALIMYTIGFVGMKKQDGNCTYSIERSKVTIRDLLDSILVVHHAFRPYLGIK